MNFTPAAENAANSQITATAATTQTATATEQREQRTTPTNRRRTPSDPVWSCLTVARRMFNNLPSALQKTDTKQMCLQEAAERAYGDPKRAKYDILNESRKLTNLKDFEAYCNGKKVEPANVAQHVVFEGKTIMRRVMEHGVESVLGTKIEMFREPLVVVDTPSAEVATSTPAERAEQSA